ncbi:MAG TPA: hypothetical protein VFV73_29925 [Streptosporangiaceae bacterium]|nr:hypothetical protein [Streptosporangiaceae bacterium]
MTSVGRDLEAAAPAAPPARTPVAALARRAALAGLGVLAVAALYFAYWRQSLAVGLSSDGSGNILQAWDMLHGNLLLTGWWVSDVSFYTTELPQYALIEWLTGLGPWVVHAAAAMTYTLLVLLSALLAKGSVRGGAGWARALLAAGLMVSPQLSATSVVLLSPDHTGTAVPLLVIWLLIDRARPRWYVPVLVCLMFILTMAGDSIILLTGVAPLVLIGTGRAVTGLIMNGLRHVPAWYELSLAVAAAAGGLAGSYGPRVMAAWGGYQQSPVSADTDLSQLQHGSWVTLQGFLELFGANVLNPAFYGTTTPAEVAFVWLHLAGALIAAIGFVIGLVRIFRPGDLIVPVFAVAILANVGAYMISTHAQDLLGAREMAAVLPLAAVLAGRVLGDRLAAWTRAARSWLTPVLAVLAAGYLAALGFGASQPARPGPNEPLAACLSAHGLTGGLATYWQANSTNVDSHGRLVLSAVVQDPRDRLVPYLWETNEANYDPARRYANFVVADGPSALPGMKLSAELTFGKPAQIYQAGGYTIMVWNKNLLTELNGPGLT